MDFLDFIEHDLKNRLIDTIGIIGTDTTRSVWDKVFEAHRKLFTYYVRLANIAALESNIFGKFIETDVLSIYPNITFQQYVDEKMKVSNYGRDKRQIISEFHRNMSDKNSDFYKNMAKNYELKQVETVLKNRLIYFVTLHFDKQQGKYITPSQDNRLSQLQNITPYFDYVNSTYRILDDDLETEILKDLEHKYAFYNYNPNI